MFAQFASYLVVEILEKRAREKINGKTFFRLERDHERENSTANKGFLYFLNDFIIECGLKLQILSTRWVENRCHTTMPATAVTLDSLNKFKELHWRDKVLVIILGFVILIVIVIRLHCSTNRL